MKPLKNKSSVMGLLVVAAVVWGVVIFRLFSFSGGRQAALPVKEDKGLVFSDKADSLILNYRDPFGGLTASEKIAVLPILHKRRPVGEPGEVPLFRYAGKISKGKLDFLLIVSGDETRLIPSREKEIDGFRVERVYNDSLWVWRKKKRYTVRME